MRPTFALGGLALAVLVAGSGLALALRDDAPPTVQVRLAAAQRGQVTASVSAAGSTVDGSRRDLAFGSSGTLTKVSVKVGTKVRKGQVLARIDGRGAREAYAAAKADLAAAQEALDEAATTSATSSSSSSAGSTGSTGGTSATCAPTSAAGGVYGPSDPSRDRAAGTVVDPAGHPGSSPSPSPTFSPRPTTTPTTGPSEPEPQPTVTVTVTATVTATVTTTVTATPPGSGGTEQAGGRPSGSAEPSTSAKPSPSGKASGRPTGAGKPSARPSTGANRPSQGSCARPDGGTGAKGGLSEEQATANVDRAEAALEEAADAVRATRIVAPAAGTVLSVAGRAGDAAGAGTFISLGNLNELQVQAMVTESDVNRLKLGQKAQVTLATRTGERYEGTVTAIAPTATVDGQLVRYSVTLAFDEPPAGLMLGQTASVTVTTDEAENTIFVPAAAVRDRPDGTQVVTVRSGGRDTAKAIRTGVRGDQYVEVTSGLAESDQIVMSGGTSGEFPDGSWPDA
ncbi:HlyD family secretion protein [Nonomuraea solani]|uniref:HlyD family secretion protein n=1 Tax=Nonomuraea solani TaxID=1144553 RepID=A0A1H6ESH3_9ACTN|nr:efflux RND transporter periplasmic adaptor subunit [Nonomuraea solani]SEH00041.1 HlyD family secretion protein [Nonomuraea solani]